MQTVAAMTEKAVELGFQPPSRDEINEILRSPSRRRKTISTWAKGDSPRENWLIENVSSGTITKPIKNYNFSRLGCDRNR